MTKVANEQKSSSKSTKIQKFPYKTHSEFLALRAELQGKGKKDLFRIGASDVPTIYRQRDGLIGLNEYSSPTVFFYEKCGFFEKMQIDTLEMTRGSIQESVIYNNYWRYLDPEHPTNEAFLENFHGNKTIFRTARRGSAIFINPKYPWLAVSPDYIMSKPEQGPLELKSPSSRANEKYEAGISRAYVIQTHVQMLVLDKQYAELFAVTDATYPQLYQYHRDPEIDELILESSLDFHNRVLEGKKIMATRMSRDEKEQALSEYAPEDHGDPLYTRYLKDKHKPENAKLTLQGNSDQLELTIEYLQLKEAIKADNTSLLEKENKMREWFVPGVGAIEWPDIGKISWVEKFTVPSSILKRVLGS